MLTYTSNLSAVLLLVTACMVHTQGSAQGQVWELGSRELPPSAGVSDVFHESLAGTPTPDVTPALQAPDSEQEWRELAATRDAASAAVALQLAEALSVDVREDQIAGVNVHWITPTEIDDDHAQHLFVYVHGGAFFLNGGRAGTIEPTVMAARMNVNVVSIDYRMPPGHPSPAATDDVIAVWKELLKSHAPGSMAMGGTSAGGNITLCSVLRIKEEGLPTPGAVYAGTPTADLQMIGDSRYLNDGVDRILLTFRGLGEAAVGLYAGDIDLRDPSVSPVYGDFTGFPPTYVISGTRDLLLSDAVRIHRAIRRAGSEADLHVYEGMGHGDYLFVMNAPESYEHYAELNAFLLKHLHDRLPSTTPVDESADDIMIPSSAVR